MHNRVQSFEDLEIYKSCIELQQAIFEATKRWPKEEMYSLIDQVRRSSRAIGECIAEGWAKRRYTAHFISEAPCGKPRGNLLRRSSLGYAGRVFAEPCEAKNAIPSLWQPARNATHSVVGGATGLSGEEG